jgi:hypothetical protein
VPLGKNKKVMVNWRSDSSKTYIYTVVIPENYNADYFHPVEFRHWKISVNGKKASYSNQPLLLKKGNYAISYSHG